MKFALSILLIVLIQTCFGQQLNYSLEHRNGFRVENELRADSSGLSTHFGLRPYRNDQITDNKGTEGSWFRRKLFTESFLEVHEGGAHVYMDPLINGSGGQFSTLDSTGRLFENTRGVRVQVHLGDKFSFETRAYESQVFLPVYLDSLADDRDGLAGRGRSKAFKGNGHDLGYSMGYFSYSPNDQFNFQFGQGSHFIGHGYRSMLLSDYAPTMTYLSGEWSSKNKKWLYKNITSWLRSFERLPYHSTPEATFKMKNGSFRYLSFKPNKYLEVGLFEGVMHRKYDDSLGTIPVDAGFYIPIMGTGFLFNTNVNKQLLGLNIGVTLGSTVIYSQVATDEFGMAYQAGVKSYDLVGIEGLWVNAELNSADSYMYGMNEGNELQRYTHSHFELTHPLGAGFSEYLMRLGYDRGKYFVNASYVFSNYLTGMNQEGQSVFWPYNEASIPSLSNASRSYWSLEGGWIINPVTRLQLYGSFQKRTMTSFKTSEEMMIQLGVRTRLNNEYKDL